MAKLSGSWIRHYGKADAGNRANLLKEILIPDQHQNG
jgi:hypothetical protein